jgi:large subunit ribosomal protein L7/L12
MNDRTYSLEVKAIGDQIAALTLSRAAELGEYLEKVHRIKVAAAPVVRPERLDKIEPLPPPPPTDFDVVYDGFEAAKKINVIKMVRELTGLGLKEAKDLVEGPPRPIKQNLPKEEAERLKSHLEAAGAKVSVRAAGSTG